MPKTFYWLKLKSDFFTAKEIKKLNRQAGGDKYVIIYLRMLLLSLPDGGMIYCDGIEDNIVDEIALTLDLYNNDVRVVFEYLLKTGLAVQMDDGAYFLPQAADMTGKESDSAERKRRQRNREAEQMLIEAAERDNVTQKRDNVQNCHTELDIDIESEKEKESDLSIDSYGAAPSKQEIDDYIRSRGGKIDADRFWRYYEALDWKNKKGEVISDWKSLVEYWEKTEHPSANNTSKAESSFNTDDFYNAALGRSYGGDIP